MPEPPESTEGAESPIPEPKKKGGPRKPPKAVGSVAPAARPLSTLAERRHEMQREQAAHDRDVALLTLNHELEQAASAAGHKRRVDWVMLACAVAAIVTAVAIGLSPSPSDDLKKTLIGFLALIVTNGFTFVLGKAVGKH